MTAEPRGAMLRLDLAHARNSPDFAQEFHSLSVVSCVLRTAASQCLWSVMTDGLSFARLTSAAEDCNRWFGVCRAFMWLGLDRLYSRIGDAPCWYDQPGASSAVDASYAERFDGLRCHSKLSTHAW